MVVIPNRQATLQSEATLAELGGEAENGSSGTLFPKRNHIVYAIPVTHTYAEHHVVTKNATKCKILCRIHFS
jgi:hypothetical protein